MVQTLECLWVAFDGCLKSLRHGRLDLEIWHLSTMDERTSQMSKELTALSTMPEQEHRHVLDLHPTQLTVAFFYVSHYLKNRLWKAPAICLSLAWNMRLIQTTTCNDGGDVATEPTGTQAEHTVTQLWTLPNNSGKYRLRLGFPTENVVILVVTDIFFGVCESNLRFRHLRGTWRDSRGVVKMEDR